MWTDCCGRPYTIPIPEAQPCPFCGKHPVMECFYSDEDDYSTIWVAQCAVCHIQGIGDSVDEAVSKWNSKAKFKGKDNVIALLNEKHKIGTVPGYVYNIIMEFLAGEGERNEHDKRTRT